MPRHRRKCKESSDSDIQAGKQENAEVIVSMEGGIEHGPGRANAPDKLGADLQDYSDRLEVSRSVSSTRLILGEVSSDDFLSVLGDMDGDMFVKPELSDVYYDIKKTASDTAVHTHLEPTQEFVTRTESDGLVKPDNPPVHSFVEIKEGAGTTKCQHFILESMGNGYSRQKCVDEIPGIGRKYGEVLKEKGIITAKNLFGHYLINPEGFKEYLIGFGFDAGSASEAYCALKMWDDNH